METSEFSFDLDARMVRVSDEEILRAVKELGGRLKRGFRIREWQAWRSRPCSAALVIGRFGGWSVPQRRVGLDREVRCIYKREELMEKLEGAWRKLGRPPGASTLWRAARVRPNAYKSRWGSLRRACELLSAHKRGKISKEEMLRPTGERVKTRREVKFGVRFRVLERDGHKCVICGQGAADGAKLEVDHIVPVCMGGGSEMENLRTLCRPCNRGKSDRL